MVARIILHICFLMSESKSIILRNPAGLLHSIIVCLNQLLGECPKADDSKSPFNLRAAPTISISDYLASTFHPIQGCSSI
jgi:hypothetical protein